MFQFEQGSVYDSDHHTSFCLCFCGDAENHVDTTFLWLLIECFSHVHMHAHIDMIHICILTAKLEEMCTATVDSLIK